MRRTLVCTVALAVALAACSGKKKEPTAAPATSSTVAGTVTTAAAPVGDVASLTGLPLPDAGRRARPALVVKIDNAPKARPQAGINAADIVVVEKVEDGVTRLAVVFHSNDADPIGPVRSARSTDVFFASALNRPLFAYSGANAKFVELLRNSPLEDVGIDNFPGEYRRQPGRAAPYNLFTTTAALYKHTPADADPPPALFTYRPAGTPAAGAGIAPMTKAHIEYLGDNIDTIVDYAWDGAGWKRTQDGTPFVDAAGVQVAPKNVVIQQVNYRDTGLRDRSNTVVPEAVLVGTGDALVLTDGKLIRAKWSKKDDRAVTTFVDSAGAVIALTPGTTWLELASGGSSARVSP